ncbi:MAG: hypothetical protein ACI9IP_001916 [Arcticibacterium sp.]|jgi:hypothetical protein
MEVKSAVGIKKADVIIDTERIKATQTIDYLQTHSLNTAKDLDKVLPICHTEYGDFHLHQKAYEFNYSLKDTWEAYKNIPPKTAWSGSNLMFSFTYDSQPGKISYSEDHYEGMKENQLVFIVIKLLFGFFKLAVTHFVHTISEDEKKVKLCYVEGGKSSGSQYLYFEKLAADKTKVIHHTYYKSESNFRDKWLYPPLHGMIISQFHNNVKKYLAAK